MSCENNFPKKITTPTLITRNIIQEFFERSAIKHNSDFPGFFSK
jgi:hypothetical protein